MAGTGRRKIRTASSAPPLPFHPSDAPLPPAQPIPHTSLTPPPQTQHPQHLLKPPPLTAPPPPPSPTRPPPSHAPYVDVVPAQQHAHAAHDARLVALPRQHDAALHRQLHVKVADLGQEGRTTRDAALHVDAVGPGGGRGLGCGGNRGKRVRGSRRCWLPRSATRQGQVRRGRGHGEEGRMESRYEQFIDAMSVCRRGIPFMIS